MACTCRLVPSEIRLRTASVGHRRATCLVAPNARLVIPAAPVLIDEREEGVGELTSVYALSRAISSISSSSRLCLVGMALGRDTKVEEEVEVGV